MFTGILTSAFRLRIEPLTSGSNHATRNTKIKRPFGRLIFVAESKGFPWAKPCGETVTISLRFTCEIYLFSNPTGKLVFAKGHSGPFRLRQGLISLRYIPLGSFAMLTGILTSAFRLRIEPLTSGSNPATCNTKIKRPFGRLIFVAESKGFEPLIPLPVYHISNVAH